MRAVSRLTRTSASPSKLFVSAICRNSAGVLRECRPRPPQIWMPSSPARGLRPRLRAPITDVVIPDECQSMPITLPSDWNQNGSLKRERNAERPYCAITLSAMAVPSVLMRVASHAGTRPPWSGRSAMPDRLMVPFYARAIWTFKDRLPSGTAGVTARHFIGAGVPYVRFRRVAIDLRLNELTERIWWAHEQIVSRSRAERNRKPVSSRGGGDPSARVRMITRGADAGLTAEALPPRIRPTQRRNQHIS